MTSKISEETKPVVCCYCLADSNKHNRYDFLLDEKQVFEKMVMDTLNIQISYLKSFVNMICTKCAENILSVAEFKKKILNAQKMLKEQCEGFIMLDCVLGKQEIDSNVDELECDDRRGDEMEKMINNSDNDEIKKTKAKGNEAITCNQKSTLKLIPMIVNEFDTKRRKTRENISKKATKLSLRRTERNLINRINDSEKLKSTKSEYLKQMKNNSIKLLLNSNMILFKSKRTSYGCYSCKKTYFDVQQLREHSQTHSGKSKIINNLRRSHGMAYQNVDISDLTCTKCFTPCKDLNDLREHLETTHSEAFKSPGHLFVPFKLEDGFKCVICREEFHTFGRLTIHMNSHSTSNVCEKCGVAYTSRLGLRCHINSTHTEQKCPKCPTVLPNKSARATHLRVVHSTIPKYKRYCPRCEMTFSYSYQLQDHMVDKHGAKKQTGSCVHCGKEFPSSTAVKIHIRSVHVGERKYPCRSCDVRCFTSYDRQRHERTHRDEKSFSCDFCEVKFKSKDSVRRHLKKQHSVT